MLNHKLIELFTTFNETMIYQITRIFEFLYDITGIKTDIYGLIGDKAYFYKNN